MKIGKRIAAAVALALLPAAPTAAQDYPSSGAVFALLDQNEWCPGGSVYLDLRTGSFMLYPRVTRPACVNHSSDLPVEQGKLEAAGLERLRAAYAKTRRAGLKRDQCDVVINNGGPQVLVITAPGFQPQRLMMRVAGPMRRTSSMRIYSKSSAGSDSRPNDQSWVEPKTSAFHPFRTSD